jgi:hypothetical protein
MLEGALRLEVAGSVFQLGAGDAVRYVLSGPSRFQAVGKRDTRYVLAIVHSVLA